MWPYLASLHVCVLFPDSELPTKTGVNVTLSALAVVALISPEQVLPSTIYLLIQDLFSSLLTL